MPAIRLEGASRPVRGVGASSRVAGVALSEPKEP